MFLIHVAFPDELAHHFLDQKSQINKTSDGGEGQEG